MANLLDTIRNNSQQAVEPQGQTDETQKLQGLLRAKSGKAVGGSAVADSNLGEQQAVTQTNQQLQNQVAPQAAIQAAGQETQQQGIQQQEQAQRASIAQAKQLDTIQTRVKTNQILNDLSRQKGQVDMDRDKSALEQAAFNLRMQNTQYIDNLQREGAKGRLNNEQDFKQALEQATFDQNLSLLQNKLGDQSILNANDRDFQKSLATMSADEAYQIYKNDAKTAKDQAMFKAISGGAQSGVSMYGASQSSAPTSSAPASSSASTTPTATPVGGKA